MKKRYWLLWTYIANFGSRPMAVEADSPLAAARQAFPCYFENADWVAKATLHIFSRDGHEFTGTPETLSTAGESVKAYEVSW